MTWSKTPEAQKLLTPDQAIEMLKEGNRRFVNNQLTDKDLAAQVKHGANGQYPFAVILGCIDSRVPAEIVFDQGIGDIFNVRIAGNIINNDILGSIEYGCKVAGSKLVLVLGHTSCGAVKGAVQQVDLGHITELLSKVIPAINSITDPKPDSEDQLGPYVNKVAEINVHNSIKDIHERSSILKELEDEDTIKIIGALYDVKTGIVNFL